MSDIIIANFQKKPVTPVEATADTQQRRKSPRLNAPTDNLETEGSAPSPRVAETAASPRVDVEVETAATPRVAQ